MHLRDSAHYFLYLIVNRKYKRDCSRRNFKKKFGSVFRAF